MNVYVVLVAIISYLIGSINFAVIISKKFAGVDVRQRGSGNAGTSNMLRTLGKKYAALTLLCDVLKGVAAVLLALLISFISKTEASFLIQVAGIMAVIGHNFPIFFGFKGGKGVATSLGIMLICNYKIALICLLFYVVLVAITKISALGSLCAAILFTILTLFIKDSYIVTGNYFIFGVILTLLVFYSHRSNIQRLIKGNENSF